LVGSQDERAMNRTFVGVYAQPLHQQQHHHQQQDGGFYPKDAVMAAVEECMRKQADALLHSLDGIGGRLSQLELYCYKLERSIGELRSDVMDYHGESTANFRCIDKNLRQVGARSPCVSDPATRGAPICFSSNYFTNNLVMPFRRNSEIWISHLCVLYDT
jgi:hypothetical protein